jgi:teichuronic acid biosynthesis glycosyltransferase TuaC
MRILLLTTDFPNEDDPQSGIFILRRAQAIASLGHDVLVLQLVPLVPPIGEKWTRRARAAAHAFAGDIPVHRVRAIIPPHMIAAEYVPLLLRRVLEREIRRVNADLVHASYIVPTGAVAVRQRLVPAIVTTHGYDAYDIPHRRPGLRHATVRTARAATRVTAVSGFLAKCVEDLSGRAVDVIWNGADERFFYPRDRAACRAELQLPPDRTVIAYAGHVIADKGVRELVEALGLLPKDERPLLVVAGDGDQRALLERRAAELRVDARFLGSVVHERIGTVFGAADVVTLPSYYEGLPNVICEAMLSERAVVATNVGGVPEIVHNRRSGLLVPPREIAPLAAAFERVCADAALRDELARTAREFASRNLTWRVSAKRYEALYEEVAEGRRAPQTTIPSRTQYAS